MKKFFLILCLLILPCVAYAAGKLSYNFALGHVNNYMNGFTDYSKYLVATNKFAFNGSTIGVKSNFVNAGYLNLDEYLIAGSVNSYLFDGQDYYTMTDDKVDSNKTYTISHLKLLGYDSIAKSDSTTYTGTRVTQYIAKTTKLNGNGTYQDPWSFASLDEAGPTITFTPDRDATWQKNRSVTINITDELSKIRMGQSLKYRWQTSATCSTSMSDYTLTAALSNVSTDSKPVTATVTDSSLAGQYYLCIAAGIEDTKGNASAYTRSGDIYAFSNNTPTITALNTSVSDSNVNLSVSYSSNLSISQYYYGVGAPSSCNPSTGSSNNTYAYTLTDGTYDVCSKIVDAAGNISAVVTKSVTVSTVITYAQLIADYSCANGSAGAAPYIMVYSGNCAINNDSGTNWRVVLSSTGNLTFNKNASLNAFLVGGGGGGGAKNSWCAGGGGGGGRTTNGTYTITIGTPYTISIGGGGGASTSGANTTAFGFTALGGTKGSNAPSKSVGGPGGAGGSGGGGGGANQAKTNGGTGGNGGAYGHSGLPNNRIGTVVPGGAGQGTTTCEFAEGNYTNSTCNNGVSYAGGGAGGAGQSSNGVGATGSPGACSSGYGCGGRGQGTTAGATGGTQGVVIIRNAR